MALHSLNYSPWSDMQAIGRLLKYQAESSAYEQLIWKRRYGAGNTGYHGCPYCHANPQMTGVGKRVPSSFPHLCKNCGRNISATLDTPMYNSKIPIPTWFDLMYYVMGGYETGKRAPFQLISDVTD